jgi:tyrosine-protein kinase Etk/Wzc
MADKDNLISVVGTLFRYRRPILWATFLTGIGSLLISVFLLDNVYKATTSFYPLSSDVFKPEQMFGTSTKDMDFYGQEADVDRLLTIGQSGDMYNFLIKKFDLYKHYKIDTTSERAPIKVREALEKLYLVKKTKENAIQVSVEDKDRVLAAAMANAARDKIDETAQRFVREVQLNQIRGFEANFMQKEKIMTVIGDTLALMRDRFGVIDPTQQTEGVTKVSVEAQGNYIRSKARLEAMKSISSISQDTLAMLGATVKGYEEELKQSVEMLKKYNSGFNSVSLMKEMYEQERNQLGRDKQRYLQLKVAYETPTQALKTVEIASVPIDKSRPKRSIIILSAMLIAFVLMVVGALVADNYRDVDWSEITGSEVNTNNKRKSSIGFLQKKESN